MGKDVDLRQRWVNQDPRTLCFSRILMCNHAPYEQVRYVRLCYGCVRCNKDLTVFCVSSRGRGRSWPFESTTARIRGSRASAVSQRFSPAPRASQGFSYTRGRCAALFPDCWAQNTAGDDDVRSARPDPSRDHGAGQYSSIVALLEKDDTVSEAPNDGYSQAGACRLRRPV